MGRDLHFTFWLIKEGEPLPLDGENVRLFRMGMLADTLISRGHTVIWWSSTFNHAEKKSRFQSNKTIKIQPNYILRLIHANTYKKNMSIGRILHQCYTAHYFEKEAKLLQTPNAILVAMPTIDLTYKAIKFSLDNNIPAIVDIRDLWPDIYEDYFPPALKPIIRMVAMRSKKKLSWALKNATGLIGVSQPYLQWGLDYAKKRQSNYDGVYPLGYKDLSVSQISLDEKKKLFERGLKDSDFICCFFGQLGKATDIETIIKAARYIKDDSVKFIICGTGENLEKLKRESSCLDNVLFYGWVNLSTICAISSISSVGIMPYKPSKNYEMNMPNKFAEFLSFGLPIMVQPLGIMRDMVGEYYCGLYYNNEEDLIDNIFYLMNNKEQYNIMSNNARSLFERIFRADVVYVNMARHLECVAQNFYNK